MSNERDINLVDKIIVHCSDSDVPEHDNITTITVWHKARGFDTIGYHFYISKAGEVYQGRPIHIKGAHCRGHNLNSIGICLGGKKDFTIAQFNALLLLSSNLMRMYPNITELVPHYAYSPEKSCPNFNMFKINILEILNKFK